MAGCQQVPTQPRTTSVLRFENLGDAEDDWQGRALSQILKRQFGAERMPRSGSAAPGISTERLAAIAAGANRLITGYYSSVNGLLDVTAFAEDTATQKFSEPVHISGDLPTVAAALAQQFGAPQKSPLEARSPALREFAIASDAAGPAAIPHYELSIQADPNFGPAYLGLMESDPAHAQQVLTAATAHAASFSNEDRAYLQLQSAILARDVRARTRALAEISALHPNNNADAIRALADAEMSSRQPGDAAQHYRQAIALAPNDPNLRNLLAYASLYAGDETGARAAAAEYRRLRPQDPNALDTLGDVELAFGNFAEAEKNYAATPWKAARARLMSGDVAGATALFEKQPKNAATDYRAAEWLYLTGRRPEGITAMAALAARAKQPEVRSAAYTQAAIWAVVARDNARAVEWATLALQPAQGSTFVLAALAKFLAQPGQTFGGTSATEVQRLATGLKLLQDGSFQAAVPVWKLIYETTNVTEPAPLYLYGWALLETGKKAEAAALFRLNPIPSAALGPSLEAFYFPAVFEWRKASLRQ